jgi:hypothetical protein
MLEGNKMLLTVSLFRGFGAFASIALVYVVYYLYSPAISAEFFIFSSFCAFTSCVLRYGLDDYILKNFSSTQEQNPLAIILKATLLSLVITLMIMPLIPIYYQFSMPWYYFLLVPVSVINSLGSSYFQARRSFYISLVGSSFIVPLATIVMIFIFSPSGIEELVLAFFLAILLQSAFLTCVCLKKRIYILPSQNISVFGKTQVVLWMNSVIGISAIHLIILVSSSYMSSDEFSNFVVLLRTCQGSLMALVVINFTFVPHFRACILDSRLTDGEALYRRTCIFGLVCSLMITGLFLAVFQNPFDLVPIRLLEMKMNFFLLWPGFAISLCFGSIGYVYILSSRERISTFVGFSTLVLQLSLIVGLNHYSYELFLILISCSYVLAKIVLYVIYRKHQQFKKFNYV